MNFFQDNRSSYIIISSDNINDVISVLHAKCYQVIPIQGFYKGVYEDSALAISNVENDEIRNDVLLLLKLFNQECAIVKYSGEVGAKKVYPDGSERPLGVVLYNTDSDNVSYLYNGISFSFVESKRYWKPNKKEDFKIGMIVEYLNRDKWFSKKIENPNEEWEKLFKLLVKYEKVRVSYD
jgi:hypothetical protein